MRDAAAHEEELAAHLPLPSSTSSLTNSPLPLAAPLHGGRRVRLDRVGSVRGDGVCAAR